MTEGSTREGEIESAPPTLQGTLLVVCGPSGVGKSTLIDALLKLRPMITMSVSHTTRQPRGEEVDGVEYHFVDENQFQEMVEEGAFAEYASVHGHHYGTSFAEINRAWEAKRALVFDIDYQGAAQLRAHYPTAITVLVAPPTLPTLKHRLQWRGTDTPDVIVRRLKIAERELAQWPHFDYVIKNEDLQVAISDLVTIFDASVLRVENNLAWLEEAYPPEQTSAT